MCERRRSWCCSHAHDEHARASVLIVIDTVNHAQSLGWAFRVPDVWCICIFAPPGMWYLAKKGGKQRGTYGKRLFCGAHVIHGEKSCGHAPMFCKRAEIASKPILRGPSNPGGLVFWGLTTYHRVWRKTCNKSTKIVVTHLYIVSQGI
jgi:hypothetical protein